MLTLSLVAAVGLVTADTGLSTAYVDRYRDIVALAPRRDSVADVNQLVLRRDAAELTLSQGTLYLLSPLGGRTVGAIFRGSGHFALQPGHPSEQETLRRLIGSPAVDDSVSEVILIFSDSTVSQLRGLSFHAATGDIPGDLRGHVHDLLESLKGKEDQTFDPDVLDALLNDEPSGFFLAGLTRVKGSPLLFQFDPAEVDSDVFHWSSRRGQPFARDSRRWRAAVSRLCDLLTESCIDASTVATRRTPVRSRWVFFGQEL